MKLQTPTNTNHHQMSSCVNRILELVKNMIQEQALEWRMIKSNIFIEILNLIWLVAYETIITI